MSSESKPTRLLIADDHPVVQQGLATVLARQAEFQICATAADGRQALREAFSYRPEIVIMNYQMPLLDGLAAARQIKQRLPSIEVLLFSGASSPHILLEIYHAKVIGGILLKNEGLHELFPALAALRGHHRFRSRGITELCEKILAGAERYQSLTPRERELMHSILKHPSLQENAAALGIGTKTIGTHRTNLFRKLNVHSAAEVVRYAYEHGLVG